MDGEQAQKVPRSPRSDALLLVLGRRTASGRLAAALREHFAVGLVRLVVGICFPSSSNPVETGRTLSVAGAIASDRACSLEATDP